MSRESAKNLLAAVFLFILAAMMVDRIDDGFRPRVQDAVALFLASGLVVAYYWLRAKTPSAAREKGHSRDALIVGLVFSTGLIAAVIRAFVEGWNWSYVGMVVPAWMAWSCFKLLFHPRPDTAAHPKISGSA